MPDSTTNAIDRLFDFVDSGVEKIDRVLNRAKYTEEQHQERRAKRVTAVPRQKSTKKTAAALAAPVETTTAIARKPRFYIAESIGPSGTLYIVTDGGNARAECSSHELAKKLLLALESA